MNAKLQYAVVEVQSSPIDVSASSGNAKRKLGNVLKQHKNLFLIVALDLIPTLEAKWGIKLVVKKTISGSDLEKCRSVLNFE